MATLKSLVDETTNIKNEIVEYHSNLSSILTSKNVEVSEEDKMSDLIGKVELFDKYVPSILYLYKEGDECVSVTGGFSFYGLAGSPTCTKKTNSIYMYNSSGWKVSAVGTEKTINLSNYSKLYLDGILAENGYIVVQPSRSIDPNTGNANSNGKIVELKGKSSTVRQIYEIDISNVNSSYVINVMMNTSSSSTINIYKMWLEK